MSLEEKLRLYAENNFNVLLIGSHGIGKSTVVKEISENMGLVFKYYSSSTLDPFAELIGIPVPDKATKTIDFYRPQDLDTAEFIFFDELNRAHPRVLNTVLEIIQFKSINGKRLENLKMVWAAINPPEGDYQVEELDPALVDRFHFYVQMKPTINTSYFKNYMHEDIAMLCKHWWQQDLSKEQQALLTPRRLEYIGTMLSKDIPFKDALPLGMRFPVEELERRLRILRKEEDDFVIDENTIIEKKDELLKRIKVNKKDAIKIADVMKKFSENQWFECRDLIEEMPKELVAKVAASKFTVRKKKFLDLFKANNININDYPKIAESFQ